LSPQGTKREGGAALLVTVLLLALMDVIGLASLDTVMRDRQMTGFQNQAQTALYAADAGVADALDTVWNVRVQGNAPGGATSRLQVTAERCHAFAN
jgi:Tfp pilus assembly protein PilX